MNKLIRDIKDNSMSHGSIPFWSWNDRLDPEELRRQIRTMHDMGMRGFFMHARGGLETEYLSDEWYACVKACIDEAKKLGMEAWAYDENGWPSGFAGGKLLEDADHHAVFVEGVLSEEFPTPTDTTVGIYATVGGTPVLTETPVEGATQYLHITWGTDGSYVDTMRADITEKFIAATHAEYERILGDDFGGAMPGFFTDEPQYYRWKTPYSRHMEAWFLERYGYSVKEALPALFIDYEGAERHRYDYHALTHDKFTNGFAKPLYDWATEHGIRITGHFVEESNLAGQMLCCGDIMPQYQYEHIPGIDYLGRGLASDLAARQLGSVCAQTGKPQALSEMFACCGWDVTPRELKHIAELQYAGGVNVMCQHLYPYSIRGQRKRDYPAFYSEHSLWQKDQPAFNEYFNHVGYMLGMGRELADTLVIHPIRSAWLTYQRIRSDESVATLDRDLRSLIDRLSGFGIGYHFGCEGMMEHMATVENGVFTVGCCSYRTVVIPACDTLTATTVRLLKDFIAQGGTVYTYLYHLPCRIDGDLADLSFLEGLPDLSDADTFAAFHANEQVSVTRPALATEQDVRTMVRVTEYGRLIYLTNLSDKDLRDVRICVKGGGNFAKIDISSLQITPIRGETTNGTTTMLVDLLDSDAVVLAECDAPALLPLTPSVEQPTVRFDRPFRAVSTPDNMLTLDRARVTLSDGAASEVRPIERIRDELLSSRYRGELTLTFPFEIRELPTHLSVISEWIGVDTLTVNGQPVRIGEEHAIDRTFRKTDITPYLTVGENTVGVTLSYYQRDYVYYVLYGGVSETLRNCLLFDTELEAMYLVGDFAIGADAAQFDAVDGVTLTYDTKHGFPLVRQTGELDIRNLVTCGYPFFSGEVAFETTLTYRTGDPTLLCLEGRYMTCHVAIDGREVGTLLFSKYIDLAPYLTEGEHTVRLTLTNNYRNLLGPHHHQIAEPTGICPAHFSFEKGWHDGACADFRDRYSFTRFGVDV